MALSAELAMRLEGDEPLSKRLKLAENAYCSTDLAINAKQDIIVKWLCRTAPSHAHVWKCLNVCVNRQRCQNLDSLLHETKRILIDTIIDQLKIKCADLSDNVLDACYEVLATQDMKVYLETDVRRLCLMISALFVRIKSDDSDKKSEKMSKRQKYVINAVENFVHIYKHSSEKDDIAVNFLDHIYAPLSELVDPTCRDSSNRVGALTHKCVQQILFGKARYKQYKEWSKEEDGVNLPSKLLIAVSRLAGEMDSDGFQVALSYLFGAAVGSYKHEGALVDSLFRGLVDASGSFRSTVFNSLTEYLADVPLDYENKISDLSLTGYLENLIDETTGKEDLGVVEYDLLFNIARLNPLIIDSKLSNIFKRILLEPRETEAEERSYVKLMIGILNASTKLRRQHKLLPSILIALKSGVEENEDHRSSAQEVLPDEFISEFTRFVGGLQTQQIIAIAKSLKFHLKSNCVDGHEKTLEDQVRLTAECTGSLLVSFFKGVRVYEHTVPLALQQKFIAILGELGEVIYDMSKKILNKTTDKRLLPLLFQITLSWLEIKSLFTIYAPAAGAEDTADPVTEEDLKRLIPLVENSKEKRFKTSLNNLLLYKIRLDTNNRKGENKITGLIGGLENYWQIIISSYPELVALLDFDQLSELASLILKDVVAKKNGLEKWRDLIRCETLQEHQEFNIAVLCHALKIIGSVVEGSESAAIVNRIDLIQILKNCTDDADVPALNCKEAICEVAQWPDLNKQDAAKIMKCLEILLCLPLSWLSVPLRTMIFVTTYVIARELESDKEIGSACEKILTDTAEEGTINVFDFIDMTALMTHLPRSKVLQKVFNLSLRNFSKPASSSEYLIRLGECPEKSVAVVLSCIDAVKTKLSNEQKQPLAKVEKKLIKTSLRNAENDLKSADKTRSVTIALKAAISRNKIKEELKHLTRDTLMSIFGECEEEAYVSSDENQNSDGYGELIKTGLELATIALPQRARLGISDELVTAIWASVLDYPQVNLLSALLQVTVLHLFKQILSSLQIQTEKYLRANDVVGLNNALEIWKFIIEADINAAKSKARLETVRNLLQLLHTIEISHEIWADFTKLLLIIVETGRMRLSGDYVDMITSTAAKSLSEGNLLVYDNVLVLCLALLRNQLHIMSNRIPILLQLFIKAVRLILREAKTNNMTNNRQLALCLLNIEKVSTALVKLKKSSVRICPYVISDLVDEFGSNDLQPEVKETLENCIHTLQSMCDPHGVNLLSRGLPSSKREIFKALNETYKKFHRFTGKI